jgi:hypothetical protein
VGGGGHDERIFGRIIVSLTKIRSRRQLLLFLVTCENRHARRKADHTTAHGLRMQTPRDMFLVDFISISRSSFYSCEKRLRAALTQPYRSFPRSNIMLEYSMSKTLTILLYNILFYVSTIILSNFVIE